MLVWMTHPNHGKMPCYTLQEVEQAKVHGWSEETIVQCVDAATMKNEQPKRRGRPSKVKS